MKMKTAGYSANEYLAVFYSSIRPIAIHPAVAIVLDMKSYGLKIAIFE